MTKATQYHIHTGENAVEYWHLERKFISKKRSPRYIALKSAFKSVSSITFYSVPPEDVEGMFILHLRKEIEFHCDIKEPAKTGSKNQHGLEILNKIRKMLMILEKVINDEGKVGWK